jgi:hypothetical protein
MANQLINDIEAKKEVKEKGARSGPVRTFRKRRSGGDKIPPGLGSGRAVREKRFLPVLGDGVFKVGDDASQFMEGMAENMRTVFSFTSYTSFISSTSSI